MMILGNKKELKFLEKINLDVLRCWNKSIVLFFFSCSHLHKARTILWPFPLIVQNLLWPLQMFQMKTLSKCEVTEHLFKINFVNLLIFDRKFSISLSKLVLLYYLLLNTYIYYIAFQRNTIYSLFLFYFVNDPIQSF